MISEDELKKYEPTYSAERLSSFAYSEFDNIQDVVTNYKSNIQISQAIYP